MRDATSKSATLADSINHIPQPNVARIITWVLLPTSTVTALLIVPVDHIFSRAPWNMISRYSVRFPRAAIFSQPNYSTRSGALRLHEAGVISLLVVGQPLILGLAFLVQGSGNKSLHGRGSAHRAGQDPKGQKEWTRVILETSLQRRHSY